MEELHVIYRVRLNTLVTILYSRSFLTVVVDEAAGARARWPLYRWAGWADLEEGRQETFSLPPPWARRRVARKGVGVSRSGAIPSLIADNPLLCSWSHNCCLYLYICVHAYLCTYTFIHFFTVIVLWLLITPYYVPDHTIAWSATIWSAECVGIAFNLDCQTKVDIALLIPYMKPFVLHW